MSERSIFLNALDREDPVIRAAYLDEACAGRPELRQRIERLLLSHSEQDTFLETPALEQLARNDQALNFLETAGEPGSLGRMDHYDVLEVVGRGATGLVLKARDTKLQRIVALKVLAPRLAASQVARARFVREAQAMAAVRDDHVIAVYAVSDDRPLPYLVMEFIGGVTLAERLAQGKPLELPEIVRIGLQTARGLAAAHAQGLIHRDIKPANILLENGVQRVKITDFGLAQAADHTGQEGRESIVGTPPYMSPCQARGEPTTESSDLFSLGSVLYTLCCRRPPFGGESTIAVLKSVCEDTPIPIRTSRPEVPDELCALIDKLLSKNPRDGYASAREVADLLTAQLARLQDPLSSAPAAPVPDQPPSTAKSSLKPPAASPGLWLLVAVGLIAALGGLLALGGSGKLWQQPSDRPGDETESKGAMPVVSLDLRREDIPPHLLALAGGGDPKLAPPELAAALGDGRFLLPRIGQAAWMEESPDGKVLAVPFDEDVVLFETSTGRYLRTLKGSGGRVFHLAFSCDGHSLAATSRHEAGGGLVQVWDSHTGKPVWCSPQPGPGIPGAAAFSIDGLRLCTSGDGELNVWDARSGQKLQTREMPKGSVQSLSFRPDGKRFAIGIWHSKAVQIFDWDGTRLDRACTLQDRAQVGAVAYSPDGKVLASANVRETTIRNASNLEELYSIPTSAQQLAFTPDSRTLCTATTVDTAASRYTFTRWDLEKRSELPPLSAEVSVEPIRAFHCLSRDGKVLYVLARHGATYVRAIDMASRKELFPRSGHTAQINAVAISPNGLLLASAGEDWVVKLWDLASGRVLHSLAGHTKAVWGLAFSPNGKLLASGSRDGTIAIWDVDRGVEVRNLRGNSRSVSRLEFSPDGSCIAAGGEGGIIKRWNVADGKEHSPLPGHTGNVLCVAFSRNGRWLASGGEDRKVLMHDLNDGSFRKFQAPTAVNHLSFSSDSRTLAAGDDSPNSAVRLWDLATGIERTCSGPTGRVLGLAFSPVAPLLAACGDDGAVRWWDCGSASSPLRTIGPGPFGGAVGAVAFTPDGRYVATANANGSVFLLNAAAIPSNVVGDAQHEE